MASSSRPILAAPGGEMMVDGAGSPGRSPQQPSKSGSKPKRTLIESACAACRKRKSKCDGQRPACTRCQALKTECIYEAQEGESRWKALRRRAKDIENERDDLRELLTFLQTRPESEALDIFNRIRQNGFEDLLRLIRHAREDGHTISSQNLITPQNVPPGQQRLPSIHSMLENSTPVQPQAQAQGGTSTARQHRMPSMSSDGSGESYSSNYSMT